MEYLLVNDDIHLQVIKLSYADLIFQAIDKNRNFLRKWLPFVDQTRKPGDTKNFIRQMLDRQKKRSDYIYTIWYKGSFAGLVGYKETDFINKKTELGYWLTENMQGKGIMRMSVKKLVDFAFRNLGLNRVEIKVAVGNTKSSAIPQKLGFVFEGIERAGEFHTNRFNDLETFSMLKSEWIENLLQSV